MLTPLVRELHKWHIDHREPWTLGTGSVTGAFFAFDVLVEHDTVREMSTNLNLMLESKAARNPLRRPRNASIPAKGAPPKGVRKTCWFGRPRAERPHHTAGKGCRQSGAQAPPFLAGNVELLKPPLGY